MNDLLEFMLETAERPGVWGLDDCCAQPARWVERIRGVRLNFPKYSTQDEAYRLVEEFGGLVNLWDHALEPAALEIRHGDPRPGDVGIIHVAGTCIEPLNERGLIYAADGIGWVRRIDKGYSPIRPRPRYQIKTWCVLG